IKYDGSVVWSRVWGLEDDPESPMFEMFPKGSWPPDHPLLKLVMENGQAQGLMNTPAGPMYVAAQPIVTSLVGSPPNGVLVMGRFLDHEFAERLRERTGVPFTIRPSLGSDVSLADFRLIGTVEGESVYVHSVDEGQHLAVIATCCDFQNENTFLIGATIPRTFFLKGQEALRYSLISLLLAGALIIVAVMGSAQVIVVRPLGALVRSLVAVRSSGDLHGRVDMARGDELGILANEFNAMMARLETDNQSRLVSEEQLRSREAELSALFAAAPDAIVTFDRDGRILSVNDACVRTFRIPSTDFRGRPVTSLIPALPLPGDSSPQLAGVTLGDEHEDGRELSGLRGDGSEFPLHVRVSSVKTDELYFVAIIRDITTLNELHDAMAQSRHLALIGEM
ncbi:MAG: PAS domain S-box protein, partial [Phycisphaerales bacterium]|nr:PAS domain S-box protein [Phycisphaerales bacterium]